MKKTKKVALCLRNRNVANITNRHFLLYHLKIADVLHGRFVDVNVEYTIW